MIIQLNPPMPVRTPKGSAIAHFMIDEGLEHDLKWVCFIDSTGECWTFRNRFIRADKNITQGREYISPFYDPDDVAFPNKEFIAPERGIYEFHNENLMRDQNEPSEIQPEVRATQSDSDSDDLHSFEDSARLDTPVVDNEFQKKIEEVTQKLRGNEAKIVDDFCQAYYASKMHMTGKDFMTIVDEVCLSIQQFHKDGQIGTRYWFDLKKDIK